MIASNPDTTSGRLDAARLAGSALLAIFAQFAVDTPSGYFGPADRVTTVGIGFVAGVTLVCLTAVVLRLAGQPGARLLTGLQYVLVVSAFVPPTATDPVIAGPVVYWHLLLFGQLASGVSPRRRPAARICA